MYVVQHNTLSDSFRIRIVWFQPKQDSDRIRIWFFKNRIGLDSKNSLSNHLCCVAEVVWVTFSDSNSAPVTKFLNTDLGLDPASFQIWESDFCSYSSYHHRSNRNLPVFLLKKYNTDSCYCRNWKMTLGPDFPNFFTLGPDPGPKVKPRILQESTPVHRIHGHLWCIVDVAYRSSQWHIH